MRLEDEQDKELLKAKREYEQKKAKLQEIENKVKDKKRAKQNHHKFMMGGCVAKYFPECYLCSEEEMNRIISAGISSFQCQEMIQKIKEEVKATTTEVADTAQANVAVVNATMTNS